MPFQAVPNGALVTMHGTLDGEAVANTLGFGLVTPGTVTPVALATLSAGIDAAWQTHMLPTMVAAYTYLGCSARALDVQDGPVQEESAGGGLPGALAGAVLPSNVSFVVSFRTGLGGATNRGRNYVCGLLESEVTGNTLTNSRIQALRTAYAEFLYADSVAVGWVWSVISRKIIIPLVTGRTVPITSVHITDARVDTQRRRLPR